METVKTKATLRYLRMSPRKVRLLIDLVRGMNVRDARAQLLFSKKAAARPMVKLLESAIANAKHNHDAKEETLVVKEAFVDGGPIMYRWMPRAMGRATPLRKRTSHVTLVLEGEATEKKKAAKKTEEKKDQEVAEKPAEETTEKKTNTKKKAPAKKPAAKKKEVTKDKEKKTKS